MKFFLLLLLTFQTLFSTTLENNLHKENLIKDMITKMEVDETIVLGAMYSITHLLKESSKSEIDTFITMVKIRKILDTKANSEKIKKSFIHSLKNYYTVEELMKREQLKETEIYERIAKDKKEIELVIDFTKIEIAKLLLENSLQIYQIVGKR
ncbi:MAG: hypothetical protein WC149_12670 [Arcobacteraceae bacterium]